MYFCTSALHTADSETSDKFVNILGSAVSDLCMDQALAFILKEWIVIFEAFRYRKGLQIVYDRAKVWSDKIARKRGKEYTIEELRVQYLEMFRNCGYVMMELKEGEELVCPW